MISPRNVELPPVLSYSKPHTFSTFFKKKINKCAFTLSNQAHHGVSKIIIIFSVRNIRYRNKSV